MIQPTYNRVAPNYDRTRGWPKEVERVVGAGLQYLLAGNGGGGQPKVIEVGIGTGRVGVPLAAHGAWIYGLDLSANMLKVLADKSAAMAFRGFPQHVAATVGDAGTLPFADASFDAALVVHLLHLVPDWRLVLAELQRVVRPGGAIVLGLDEEDLDGAEWVADRWREIVAEEGGALEPLRDRIARAREAAATLAAAGWSVEDHVLARWVGRRTPARLLSDYGERCYSASWNLPDDVLDRALTRLSAELARQFGSLDAELERERRFRAIVARRG